jgi:hypothetical protein
MLVAKASDERPQQDKAAVAASKRENTSFLISKFFVADCTIMLPFTLYWLSGFCKMPICFRTCNKPSSKRIDLPVFVADRLIALRYPSSQG